MSPCQTCHAGCCRSFAVPVTGADILRIERDSKLTFWDIACRWADPHGAIARNHAPHLYFEDEPGTPFVICLLQEESAYFPNTSKCRFLVESTPDAKHPLGQARCGIYHQRPGACRAFPTKFDPNNELVLISDLTDDGRGSDEPVYQLCDRPWEPGDFDQLQVTADLAVARHEMGFFCKLAAVWNRAPGPWSLFPDFLRMVYSSRVMREADTAVEQEPHTIKSPVERTRQQQRRAA